METIDTARCPCVFVGIRAAVIEWSDLRIFLGITRYGTLGAAARALGSTQPTMGRRLRTLEGALGHTLFQRTADGLVLTDEGQVLREHAERMEEEALAIERRLAGRSGGLTGSLRLTSSDWFGRAMLAPALARFSRRHPGVEIELLTDARLYSLPRREADIAFRIKRFDEPEVISRRLLTIDYALYGPVGQDAPISGDGTGVRLVTMDAAFSAMPDAIWLRRMLPNAQVAFRSNNREVQAELCRNGAGFAVLPRPLGDTSPGLAAYDLGEPAPSRDTFVGYHRDLRRLARLRALLNHLIEELGS